MNKILTALILLCATSAFAEDSQPCISSVTNNLVNTNETEHYKPRKVTQKTDAYTGATKKGKKQK
jgi:hypothetical protein